ncbi:uncharacterized protein LOC132698058 [Cylas formicarius]|uniref:uncharacterized protein LOC132698058 n=1 Tax=Cylas formicarius TaxID=197179 RepID=UPI0029589C31|nr:uncharacterized protein LOC132698058 [Cylas formicarius]
MYEAGKLANTIHGMENKRFYYSGNNDRDHRRGVGVIVTKEIAGSVTDFVPYSDRTMLLKIRTKPLNINIIQVYAPTLDRGDDEVDKFYGEIKELLGLTKPHEINIIQGDFNAKIGSLQADQIVGPYGLGDRNHRGDRLVQLCQEENFKITNTWFSLPPRRLYTWRSPQDNKENIVRNQIDFILINRRLGTSLKRRQQRKPQLAIEKLKNEEVRTTLQQKLNDGLARLQETSGEYQVDNIWDSLKKTMNSVSQNILGYRQSVPKNKWMTEEILRLMDERRKHKNVNPDQYSLLNSRIRSEIRKAKRKWLEQECQEIERLQQIHDTHSEHKKLKEVAGIYKTKAPVVLVNDKNEIILEKDERRRMWEQYIRKLFQDSERTDLKINPVGESLSRPPITKEEIRKAVQLSKNNKAVGPDEVPAEIIKLIDDDNLSLLEVVFNKIYSTGRYADDSVLIADNIQDLQQLITLLNDASKNYGLNINSNKTKFMIISRDRVPYVNAQLVVDGMALERVKKYRYLGSWLYDDWDNDKEIKARIEIARSYFLKFKHILTNRDTSLNLRGRIRRVLYMVRSIIWYGNMDAQNNIN